MGRGWEEGGELNVGVSQLDMEYMESKKDAKDIEKINRLDEKEVFNDFFEALKSGGEEEALRKSAAKAVKKCMQLTEEEVKMLEARHLDRFNNSYKTRSNVRNDPHHQLCNMNTKMGEELLWKDFRVKGVSKKTLRNVLDEAANYMHR